MAVTRIKNNQITDSTITYVKLAPGTLVGSVFNANLTLNSNVTILGNLTVANSFAQLNSINTYINDPIVVFNNNYAGSPTYDIGMLVNRNLSSLAPYGSVNAAWVWKEADTALEGLITTETCNTAGAIISVTTGGINVAVGTITAPAGLQATPIGNVTTSTAAFTTLAASGLVSFTNSTPTTGVNTGALQVTNGGAYIAGNLWVGGNINFTPGSVNTISGNIGQFFGNAAGFGALYAGINTGFVYQPQTVLQNSTNFNGYAQVNHQNINGGSLASSDYVATANNGTANDGYIDMGIASSTYNYAGFGIIKPNDGYLLVYGNATTGGGNLVLTSALNDIVFAPGGSNANNEYGRITAGNVFTIKSTVAATNTTSGALQVTGGVGIQGSAYVGGVLAATGNIVAASGTASSSTTTGALVVAGGAGISGALNVGGTSSQTGAATFGSTITASGNVVAASGTASSSTTTGALVVAGGAGVSGAVNIGGATKITDGTASSSTSTGALVVTGGVGVGGSLNVAGGVVIGGNLAVNGTVEYINSTVTMIQDPIIELGTGANGAALGSSVIQDVGIKAHFYNNNISADSSAFFGRVASSGYFEFYEFVSPVTGETANVITGAFGTIRSGQFIAANTTPSTTYSTGAIKVLGGLGVAGNINVGGGINGVIGNSAPSSGAFTTVTTTGALTTGAVLTANGNLVAASGTASSGTTTGALVVVGGAGVSGAVNIGGAVSAGSTLGVTGAATLSSTLSVTGAATFGQTGIFTGNIVAASPTENTAIGVGALVVSAGGASIAGNTYIGNNLYIGSASYSTQVGTPTIIATDNGVNYAQIALKNTNSYGSADYAAYSDLGTDAGGWVDMGVAGSGFNDGNYTITKPHDGYLITRPTDSSYGGNLVLATSEVGSYKDIVIGVGAFHSNAEVARFHGNSTTSGTFVLKLPTNSSPAANTGAFQVWGGTSVSANTYVGGAALFNGSQGAGNDFIVKGKNDGTLIWARPNATYDQVIIGNSATASTAIIGAKLLVNSTDSILLPAGTNAQRPGSIGGTDTTGMFRYNTTLNAIEYYGGATPQWNLVSSQFTVIAVDTFNGDGSTVAFTLAGPSTTAACFVSVNGIVQQPTVAYSVSGTTLTFTEAPANGDAIDVRRMTTTQTVTGIASVNGYMQMQVDNSGAYIYTGSAGTSVTTKWDTSGAEVSYIGNVSVSSANTVTTIDSFSSDAYRTAKYIIQVKNGANYQAQEVLVATDGTTATQVTYGVVQTNGNLGVVTASQSGSTTTLSFIAANATNVVRIKKDYIAI
jgi:hypothetical protein